MESNPYVRLARRLDALPNGFPAADDGSELRLLAKLFTAEEAALAAELRLTPESADEIAARTGGDARLTASHLKSMVRRGLIGWQRGDTGSTYRLIPFVVGIYEYQLSRMDAELAALFEAYYHRALGQELAREPQVHRVIPIGENIRNDLEIRPYESAAGIINGAKAWGVSDCICRTQKALIGEPCDHPRDVCLVLGSVPGFFDTNPSVRALAREEALETLRRAADAGLVHTVSNNQEGLWYVCNCCTCSCGILRGMADLGIANVVARSPFINQVNEELCVACGDCESWCQFDALKVNGTATVDALRCTGCGTCLHACPEDALVLVRREGAEKPPLTMKDWMIKRAFARGQSLEEVL